MSPCKSQFVRPEESRAAAAAGLGQEAARALLGECRAALHERRATRPRPSLDDKVHYTAHLMLKCFLPIKRIYLSR